MAAASAVTDLETGLQAMLNLKPPGVSGSRISSLTTLCVSNIQSESVLIQKIYTHFKKAPGTHKLGVLYVVDSVTRKWLEQAKAQTQPINGAAQDGTYAAGVHRVTELMPVLMNDILSSCPNEQKEKIKKLLDIWEKGQTFPAPLLSSFREKLSAPPPPTVSTTPPGSPPTNQRLGASNGAPLAAAAPPAAAPPAAAPANGSSILEALANIARQNTSATPTNQSSLAAPPPNPFPPSANSPYPQQPQHQQPQQQSQPYLPVSQAPPSLPFNLASLTGQSAPPPQGNPPNPYGAPAPAPAPAPVAPGAIDPNTQQQIMLIKALADQGVPFDKIPAIIQSLTGNLNGTVATGAAAPAAPGLYPAPGQQPWQIAAGNSQDQVGRGYHDNVKSPQRYQGRSRSRSPDRGWTGARGDARSGGRDFGGRNSPSRNRFDDRGGSDGRRSNEYRQRSPAGHFRSPTPPDPKTKWVEFDRSLPAGCIKVFSRTLFVGGVTCSENELRTIFSQFGTVQTCIVNKDKRHAFVKMLTRRDAVTAKDGTEDTRSLQIPLRTRWGVGFGPRDCSDYSTGISVIPIHKLTDADRKWMLTAPFGGSGGREIEAGLCVEEPDIEIGAGVSSKAISRRMQTDKGGSNGPKSTRHRDDDNNGRYDGQDRGRDSRRGGNDNHTNNSNGTGNNINPNQQPLGPGFPFGIGTLPNGMPNFPAGFSFPDPNGAR